MTRDDVQAWLDRYIGAWETYDAAGIGDLFTEDAEYRYHPRDEPTRGRAAIVDSWLNPSGSSSGRDVPGTYAASYAPFAVDAERAVAVGRSTYWSDTTRAKVTQEYFNVFLLEFGPDGRCRSFTEYFVRPRKAS
jgi:hypothetical protein